VLLCLGGNFTTQSSFFYILIVGICASKDCICNGYREEYTNNYAVGIKEHIEHFYIYEDRELNRGGSTCRLQLP
jgi:hypothetical protein